MRVSKKKEKLLITGAGGFIGGHLVKYFKKQGYSTIRAVDIKPTSQWHQLDNEAENITLDLSNKDNCYQAVKGIDEVYNLASNMGGMEFIENNKADCMLNVLINTHLLMAARDEDVNRYFFSSSACVYSTNKQKSSRNPGLKESDVYPAMPEDGYGWEKLFSERMCRHFKEDFGLNTYVARFHNVYGPYGAYNGGREKAPAALSRKAIEAQIAISNEIEIWGDGQQTRSFMYIEDCVKGIDLIVHSDIEQPINLGSSEMVTINQLVKIIEKIVGINFKKNYVLDAPKGVRGRSSDNTLIKQLLDWEPSTPLKTGMGKTYEWIYKEMKKNLK
jgi:GDP-D-mannose 3', 5'-epimerase